MVLNVFLLYYLVSLILLGFLIYFDKLFLLKIYVFIIVQDYDDFDTANELDELDKFFEISTKKSPVKEINGSNTVVNKKFNILLSYYFLIFVFNYDL